MSVFSEKYGPWALVTGATMGLGVEFARQLATRGLNLLLLDINAEVLTEVSKSVSKEFNVGVRPIVVDLAQPDFLRNVSSDLDEQIGLLVNIAGGSAIGHFLDLPLESHLSMLAVNVRATLILAHHFGGLMRARKRGGIIFVSSISALSGTSYFSECSATKAHDLMLGEVLWLELRPCGVDVLTMIVDAADTPGWRAENPNSEAKTWPPVVSAADTVRETLEALGKTPSFVPGAQHQSQVE